MEAVTKLQHQLVSVGDQHCNVNRNDPVFAVERKPLSVLLVLTDYTTPLLDKNLAQKRLQNPHIMKS